MDYMEREEYAMAAAGVSAGVLGRGLLDGSDWLPVGTGLDLGVCG